MAKTRYVVFFRTRSILYLISTLYFVSSFVYLRPILTCFEDRSYILRNRTSKKIFYNYEFGYLLSCVFEYLFSLKTQACCQIRVLLTDQRFVCCRCCKLNSRLEATKGNLPFLFDFWLSFDSANFDVRTVRRNRRIVEWRKPLDISGVLLKNWMTLVIPRPHRLK